MFEFFSEEISKLESGVNEGAVYWNANTFECYFKIDVCSYEEEQIGSNEGENTRNERWNISWQGDFVGTCLVWFYVIIYYLGCCGMEKAARHLRRIYEPVFNYFLYDRVPCFADKRKPFQIKFIR